MRIFRALFLCLCLMGSRPASAQPADESLPLSRVIEEYERNEVELSRLKGQLESAPTTQEAARLRSRVGELEARQDELVRALEERVGPLPPAVRDEPPVPAEKRLDSQRVRDEAILDKDVERRLPR